MKNFNFVLIVMTLLSYQFTYSQFHDRPFGPAPERIEKYKKLRLIEELNLSDEESIRFSRLYNAHLDSLKEIHRMLDEYQKNLAIYLEKSGMFQDKSKEYQQYLKEMRKILKEYESYQKKYWEENKEFLENLKQLLNEEQLARYYLFEKKFNKELRDALEKMREEMPRRRKR
ncbi:MAG: hypothetical protein IGBAC_0664 [Ignavibacteriae bacterium]|nr:MAG: hypothetical protein IGBAC_0664 [Ignavibacteriota bacterium]